MSERSHVVAGRRAVAEAVRSGRARVVLLERGARSTQGMQQVIGAAAQARVPVRTVSGDELDRLDADHRGVVALLAEVDTPRELTERDLATFDFAPDAFVVVLDGIEDPQNLGAAARTAEAAGAAVLVTRVRRSAPVTPAAVRASSGALLHLPHARVANIAKAVVRLQDAGFFVVGLDGDAETTVYDAPPATGRVAIVVGSEGTGLSRLVRDRCDALVSLPMRGRIASLNASAALAATLYAYVVPSRRTLAGSEHQPGTSGRMSR